MDTTLSQTSENNATETSINYQLLKHRFRGYFPVIVDVETSGLNAQTDGLLELAAITVKMDEQGLLHPDEKCHFQIKLFEGANVDPNSLKINGINPDDPQREAVDELTALTGFFQMVRRGQKAAECKRSILVAHNAMFDYNFLMAAINRTGIKRNPFHPFSTFDTATLAGFMFGQTVLRTACDNAGIPFEPSKAHSALYDTEKTAELFCLMVNKLKQANIFPPQL